MRRFKRTVLFLAATMGGSWLFASQGTAHDPQAGSVNTRSKAREDIPSPQENVEILEAQLAVRTAALKATEIQKKTAQEVYDVFIKAGAAASHEEKLKHRGELKRREARLEGQQAELKSAELRLAQARRQLTDASSQQSHQDTFDLLEAVIAEKKAAVKESQVDMESAREISALVAKASDQLLEKLRAHGQAKTAQARYEVRTTELKNLELRLKHTKEHPQPTPIQALNNEIELLEGEVNVRKALLRESQIESDWAKEPYRLLTNNDAMVERTIALDYWASAQAGVEIRQAELKVAELRLQQAKRRLAASQTPPTK